MKSKNCFSLFEHQTLKLDEKCNKVVFTKTHLLALQKFYGERGLPYYSLIHNGVKFCEYVGVIQVGNLLIEVLPKADKNSKTDDWRQMLLNMLKAVGMFDVKAPSSSALRLKSNHILDLYIAIFIAEVEYLLQKGLIKKYRKAEGNLNALKGSLQFNKHIQQNLVHQERFYTKYTTYDREHQLNIVLYKTIKLLQQINTNNGLSSRIGSLLLNFPEMPDMRIDDAWFEKIVFDRKTAGYKKAIEVARLLLMNYHPDVTQGQNHVLALMFDMNVLWEQFVYICLRKKMSDEYIIKSQSSMNFWKPNKGYSSTIRPDIVISKDKENWVFDTKWKNLNGGKPSSQDLHQMFAYNKFYHAKHSALVYPGNDGGMGGEYYNEGGSCSVIQIPIKGNEKIEDLKYSIHHLIEGSIF